MEMEIQQSEWQVVHSYAGIYKVYRQEYHTEYVDAEFVTREDAEKFAAHLNEEYEMSKKLIHSMGEILSAFNNLRDKKEEN